MAIRWLKYMSFFALISCTLAGNAQQEQTHIKQWSLKECLAYAQQHNITLNNLRLAKQSADQNLISAKASVLPDLNASASQNATHYGTAWGDTGKSINLNGSAGLNSSVTLFNGGTLRADIRQSQLATEMADLDVSEAGNDLYLQIIQAYTNIMLDKETIVYAQDLVQTSQAQTEQMDQQYKAGAAAKKDLIQLQAQLASDQYTLTSAKNAERQDKITLKQLLQLPVDSAFDIVKADTTFALAAIPSLHEVIQDAINKRPEIKNSLLNIENSKLDLKKAKAGYLPVISLNGGIGTNYNNGTNIGTFRQFDNNFYQQIGITATIPLFSRKVNQTNVAKSNIAIKQAELDLLNTKTILSQTVEKAYINTQNAYSQYDASAEQLNYNKEAYRIAGEELRVGSANTVEYIQQKNLYIQALQAYTQAKYSAMLSLNVFNFYKGDFLENQQ
ncbi:MULTISPECIES: TolC family protein [Olivibacter]|uniref:TolC family protein n=1 Tax=Olivibacter oleidegradans TaxID=760123 RepID=A0ABV6HK10_9SPHI|nr:MULTISPECIES: TolC family protein [Olivibacter]MDM8175268.1 TolC family protein [Olivibacter sp. 47]